LLSIRTFYSKTELPRLYAIEKACFSREFRWDKKDFIREIGESDVWIADLDGTIVGFLMGEIEDNMGHIATIDVDAEYRGRGIATTLTQHAEAAYRGCGYRKMMLEVQVDNPAQTLYFRLGYRVVGVKKSYYADGSNAITMEKKLKKGATK
jgi:ribosomal-protein-alanine N-acetyltransferase